MEMEWQKNRDMFWEKQLNNLGFEKIVKGNSYLLYRIVQNFVMIIFFLQNYTENIFWFNEILYLPILDLNSNNLMSNNAPCLVICTIQFSGVFISERLGIFQTSYISVYILCQNMKFGLICEHVNLTTKFFTSVFVSWLIMYFPGPYQLGSRWIWDFKP